MNVLDGWVNIRSEQGWGKKRDSWKAASDELLPTLLQIKLI